MQAPANKQLLALLVMAYNGSVNDFYYFPDVVLAGRQRMEPDAFRYLLAEGYLEPYRYDSFGRYYRLSKAAQRLLQEAIARQGRSRKKRTMPVAANQGQFQFA